jgi:hypothetical protein
VASSSSAQATEVSVGRYGFGSYREHPESWLTRRAAEARASYR